MRKEGFFTFTAALEASGIADVGILGHTAPWAQGCFPLGTFRAVCPTTGALSPLSATIPIKLMSWDAMYIKPVAILAETQANICTRTHGGYRRLFPTLWSCEEGQ